jgi:tRNA 2-selenouridine synthase
MAVEKLNIEAFLELAKKNPVIDVRSPGEYYHAHLPGACSLPLFSDEERKLVGTAYKQDSREAAIKIGLDFFGPRMKKMVEEVEGLLKPFLKEGANHPPLFNGRITLVYCWRGGMRSGAVSWLLDLYGFKVYTLIGGYKKFRNYVLDTFKQPFQFNILGGYTGSGKTELLNALQKNGRKIIDLEAIASHRGSAFGNIGLPRQPSQEMFENILAQELRSKSIVNSQWSKAGSNSPFTIRHSPIWLEDESQRIGDINIPHELWITMRQSPVYFLEIPFEERLKKIVKDYGPLDKAKMIHAIQRIENRLGSLQAKNAVKFMEEGNTTESFRILLKYYDKFYSKSLHNREKLDSLLKKVTCETVDEANINKLLTQPACDEKI